MHLELMRDPSRTFPTVAEPESVISAKVWHCKYKSLLPLAQMRNLEELVIASFPDASFEFLGTLAKLRVLHVMHMPKICDIGALAKLSQLTSISLATLPSWDASSKTTTIQSLEPLAEIPELAYLELLGICPPDKSLAPLGRCKHLQTARISHYPMVEIDRFFSETKVINKFNPEPSFS
ncbi:MAG: hypothetical protein V4484_09175 [Pseudomonadota bacterium]